MSIVRRNLMTVEDYTPYCGKDKCWGRQPRTFFNGSQFECPCCGWKSRFPDNFISEYKHKWGLDQKSTLD